MPQGSEKKSTCNGRKIRYTQHLHSVRMLLLFTVVGFCITMDQKGVAGEVLFTCPKGPGNAECTCSSLELNCTNVGLSLMPKNFGANIQSLILRDNGISSIDSIIWRLPQSLVYIDISSNLITSIDWSLISSLTSLEELCLQMNFISLVNLTYFHGHKLRILNVSGNQLIHVITGDMELSLEQLYIEKCGLTNLGLAASHSLCKLRILHVGSNIISSLPVNAFSCMYDLEEIDLSNNLLTSLPYNIFDGLDKLKVLNLAGNPWTCDCSLIWLRSFIKSFIASGGTLEDENVTYCSTKLNSSSNTLIDLTAYQFSNCEDSHKSRHTRQTLVSGITPLVWTTVCLLWQSSLNMQLCGPSMAASCVFNFSRNTYSFIQFHNGIHGLTSQTSCRDKCQENSHSHFAYDRFSTSCLCGGPVNNKTCAECSISPSTSPSLCGGLYSNIVGAQNLIYDVTISISPSKPQVMSKVNFTLRGGSSNFDTFSWNFGDGTTITVLKGRYVSHTYIYPGLYEVVVVLTSSILPAILPMQVLLYITVEFTLDTGTLNCPPQTVSTSDAVYVNAVFTSAWNQKTQWTRQEQQNGHNNTVGFPRWCGSLWSEFRGRCIKVVTTTGNMTVGDLTCSREAARLLRFYSLEEISELKSSHLIFLNQANPTFYTGAVWAASLESYVWRDTSKKAPVFKETLPDSDKGSCVVLTNAGLLGVNCDEQHSFVCEKDPMSCIGNQQTDGQMCYNVITHPATWDQAQLACQTTYRNGRLASISDSHQNAFQSGLLTSRTWIGLRASTGYGYYTWQDGQALGGYTNWIGGPGVEPCVSLDPAGMWQTESCDNQNNFICESFVGDEVKIPWLVAGYVPIMNDAVQIVTLTPVAPFQSVVSSRVTILLGSWFSASGKVLKWNIQVEKQAVDSKIALQVWRPFCTLGSLVQPGCNSITSPLFTCTGGQTSACSSGPCSDGKYYCLLTQTCLPLTKPCTCASVSPAKNINCQNPTNDFKNLRFELVYVTTVTVPSNAAQVQFELSSDVMVQEGDAIGFQSERQNTVSCDAQSDSEWRHSTLSASADYWMNVGNIVDPQLYQLKQDILCEINVVYTTQTVTLLPSAMNYITSPGVYTYSLITGSSRPQTCTVTAMDEIRGLLWVYPEGRIQITSGQGQKTLTINIQAGVSHDLTVKVLQGSNLSVTWFFNSGSGVLSLLYSSCPVSILLPPDTCRFHSSLIASPYSSLSHTFPAGGFLTNVVVNASNEVSWEALHVNIYSFALITEVEFYHANCMNHTVCEVTIQTDKTYEFLLKVPSGDMTRAVFYEDGQVINPTPSNLSVLPIMFKKSATYVLSVNVSNPLSWMTANLTVHVHIRAKFQDITFDKVLDKVEVGNYKTISASVKVSIGAYITVLWMLNNESFQSHVQANSTVMKISQSYRFNVIGNVTVKLLLSDMFGDSLSISAVTEVYKSLYMPPLISTSSLYVATLEDFNLTIRADNSSMSNKNNYGLLIFTVDWGEVNNTVTWTNSNPVQEVQHQYKSPGNFTISVIVMSDYNMRNIRTATVSVVAQDAITGLNLTYNGPKHVSENLTFTAALQSGSSVQYMMDFGDKNAVTFFQAGSVFVYKYSVADIYRATVTAKNEVSEKTFRLTLYAYDEYLLKIITIHARHYVAVGKTVEISAEVAAESPDKLLYDWDFGDGSLRQGYAMRYISTYYPVIGIYNISLKVKNISSFVTDRKEICVEEEITGLDVKYDTPVALKQPGALMYALFHASVVTGSNLIYTWTVDSKNDYSQNDTLKLTVTEARIFTVRVDVQNNVSHINKIMELKVIEIIDGLHIHCFNCFSSIYTRTHANTTFEAISLYGTFMEYAWHFSDSATLALGKVVQHTFVREGVYFVELQAKNIVSNETTTIKIFVQDEVNSVNITVKSTTVQIYDNVTLQASFNSGTNISCSWNCDSLPLYGSSTSLIHLFTSTGHHRCAVIASNVVSSASSSILLIVLDRITHLAVNHSLKQGAQNLYAETASEYSFTPNLNTDFLVDYEWKVQETGHSVTIFHEPILNYTFQSIGIYQITLKAKNNFSNKETSIKVEAQEQISGVYISSNSTSNMQAVVGETLFFHAVSASGSSLAYLWTVNGQAQINRNDSLVFTFLGAGNFTVQVTIKNEIGTATATLEIFVYVKVSQVAIQIKPNLHLPFIRKGTSLSLYASVFSGTSLTYNWTIVHESTSQRFTSNQVTVSFTFNLTGTYQVLLNIRNPVSSEGNHLSLVVQGAITELKVTLQDLVVASGSDLTFSGEVNPDATDVVYEWQVNGETKHSPSFTELFPVAGVYKVFITAANNVSSKSRENDVRVLDPVINLQILDCQMVRAAQITTTLNATVDFGTNVTFTWYVEMSNQNSTLTGQNVGIIFPTEKSYNVYVSASNDISSRVASCQLQLQLPLTKVTIVVTDPNPSYILQNQNVTFTASGQNLKSAVFKWSIDNNSTSMSTSNSYTTSIPDPGSHTLTLLVYNEVSRVQVHYTFTVKHFLCQLPGVSRVGAAMRTIQRSQSLELEVAVDAKSCTAYIAVHNWTVIKAPDCTGDLDDYEKVNIGNTAISSPSIVIGPRVLDVGSYCVHFATGYQYTSVSVSVFYTVNVTTSKLKSVIKGGSTRSIAAGSVINFDGGLSYDPDNHNKSLLIYTWDCEELFSRGGCFYNRNNTISFLYGGFTAGQYKVFLQVEAPGKEPDIAEQIVNVSIVQGFVPVASIVCESCLAQASYRVSASQSVALSATCDNCLCEPTFSWKILQGQTEIHPNSSQTTTGLSKRFLVLSKQGVLKDGFAYTFTVTVSCINDTSTGGASLTLQENLPPSNGSCSIFPTSIVPLEEQVNIKCWNWIDRDDPETLFSYTVFVDTQNPQSGHIQSYPIYSGTDETQSVYLSSFTGASVILRVMVGDEFGAVALGGECVIQFRNINLNGSMTKTDYLKLKTDSMLSALTLQASPVSLLQYTIALGQQLNMESRKEQEANTEGKGTISEQTRAAIRDAATICLSTAVPILTLEDIQQMALALRLLTDYSSEYLTEDSQRLMVKTLLVMNTVLQQKISDGITYDDVPLTDLMAVIRNLLGAVNARIYSTENLWETGRTVSIDNFQTDFRDLRPEIAVIVGDLEFTDISLNETHRKSVVSAVAPLLEHVLVSTLKTMFVDEDSVHKVIDGLTVKASRSYVKDIELEYTSDTAQISLPADVLSSKNRLDQVFQVMISHNRNPYTYGNTVATMTYLPVQTVSFYETNGSYIHVKDLPDSDRISLCLFPSATNSCSCSNHGIQNHNHFYNGTANQNFKNVTLLPRKSKVFQVPSADSEVGYTGGVHIQLRIPSKDNVAENQNTSIVGITAYLGINFVPSASHYSQKLTLTPDLMSVGVDHRHFTFFQNCNPYDKMHVVAISDDDHQSIDLSVGVYLSICEYYNTVSKVWAKDGCEVQADSTVAATLCLCNHLTVFGGAGIVSLSDIDFADLANLDILANPVVFIAVAIIFVLYIVVAILCRYLDNLDLKRISRIPLCGQNGAFLYEITVVTGYHYNSGTSAHVGVKLYGTQDKGSAKHITKSGAFQRNCRDTFLIASHTNLGEITSVLVWHDNTGLSPSWFLSHILVKDLQTGLLFYFLVNSWLSLEMDDGVIQKTVKAADKNELKQFNTTFSSIFRSLITDLHMWISVSNKSDHSRYSRVQRATCCLTCVYLYMSVNAMWYGLFKDQVDVDGPIKWSSFGWEEIVIALVSAMLVVPFLFGIALIFKRSRCKASIFQEALRPGSAQTIEIDAMLDISPEQGSYRTATPLAEWIPPLEKENTTDSINIPVGLKRTVPMHGSKRKGSNDSSIGGRERPPILSTVSRKSFWNKDTIMQSWPDSIPQWPNKVKAQVKNNGSGSSGVTVSAPGPNVDGGSTTAKQHARPKRNRSSKSIEDSDEELQHELDQIEAEINKSEEKRKMFQAKRLRQKQGGDLFDSDDEWVNEGLEEVMTAKTQPLNHNKEPFSNFGRRPSRTSFTLPDGTLHRPEFAGEQKRHNSCLLQDRTRPSIVSFSSKSKTTLSGRLRSLSVVSQMSTRRNSGCLLPSWCVYVAYAACFTLCLLSIILVLLYGYRFGPNVAIKWMISLCITLFISILVIEPLKVIALVAFARLQAHDKWEENSDMIDIKPKIESNEQIKDVKFRPVGGYALHQAREEGKKKQKLHIMLREVFVFTFMFAVFLALVYINYNSVSMYITSNNIRSKFYADFNITNGSSGNVNIVNLKSIPVFWKWANTVMARSLHSQELYQLENFGYLLGPALLRQQRGEIVTCPVALSSSLLMVPELATRRCVSTSSEGGTSEWTVGSINWTYYSSSELNKFIKFGLTQMYPGDGYIQELGETYNDTVSVLHQLEILGWVDHLTKAVFVEFILYSPSEDLTTSVTLLLEFPASGGILGSSTIWTERLLRFIPGHVDAVMICHIMFFLFVLCRTFMLCSALRLQKLKFFIHFWNWLDLTANTLMWTNTGLYIACVIIATKEVEVYLADTRAPAQLEKSIMLHSVLRYVQACLVFIYSLKIVRQIRFIRPLYKFYKMLSIASTPLMGAFFMFTILVLTYAQFGYLIYGSLLHGYQSFQLSLMSLFGLIGGHENFRSMFECSCVITHLFFITFGLFVYGLVIALSVAILSWSFKLSRAQMTYKTTLDARDYEMIEFMIKHFQLLIGKQKQKPAFRQVRFEGLPSLPSRGTSSNITRRSCNSPVPSVRDFEHGHTTDEYLKRRMASLQPAWERVEKAVQKLEYLDKVDEDKLQDLVNQIIKSTSANPDAKQSAFKPIVGRPPVDPKARFKSRNAAETLSSKAVLGKPPVDPKARFKSHDVAGPSVSQPVVEKLHIDTGKRSKLHDVGETSSSKTKPPAVLKSRLKSHDVAADATFVGNLNTTPSTFSNSHTVDERLPNSKEGKLDSNESSTRHQPKKKCIQARNRVVPIPKF